MSTLSVPYWSSVLDNISKAMDKDPLAKDQPVRLPVWLASNSNVVSVQFDIEEHLYHFSFKDERDLTEFLLKWS